MLLAFDIGNTQTSIGLFDGPTLVFRMDIPTEKQAAASRFDQLLAQVAESCRMGWEEAGALDCGIDDVVYASVVPCVTPLWEQAWRKAYGVEPIPCNGETAGGLFRADYPKPEEIGADRIADAIAAVHLYGAPSAVVDFGTATNIEFLNAAGCFVGGIIAPGAETSMNALFANASKLRRVKIVNPDHAIGKSTAEAILSGIVYGEADRADGLLARALRELDGAGEAPSGGFPIVATGGFAKLIAPLSRYITHVDQDLTLKGLQLLHAHLRG